MTTEQRIKLADRLQRMKTKHGVSYNHMGRVVGLANTTVVAFVKGRIEVIGDEKCEHLWKITEHYFPESK